MKRNKSPGISQRGYVSSNDSNSSIDVHQKPTNNSRIKQHSRGLSQGSYSGTIQELTKTLGRRSNSSVEDHLNDESSDRSGRQLADQSTNSCTNGSGGIDTNPQSTQNFSSTDELDSLIPQSSDAQRLRAVQDLFHSKIIRTKESIKAEQNSRDENVNEYLKLAANADKNQLQRIKSVFEKKNQKSAQTIAHLQKKLDNYNKKLKEIELHGCHHKQTREMLRDFGQGLKDVGTNIKEGMTGLSGGVFGGIKSGISGIHSAGE